MKLKKLLSIAAASVLTALILPACGSGDSDNTVSTVTTEDGTELSVLRVAVMTGQPDQYATYIGTQQGIFEKYGLSLEITEYVAGINTIDAVVNGVADTGEMADFACVNRLGNTLEDTNLVIFSEVNTSVSTSGGLYVAPQYADNIEALDGSEGIITMIGTVAEYTNYLTLEHIGLDPDKQNIIQTDSNQTSLALVQEGTASMVVASGELANKVEEYGWVLLEENEGLNIEFSSVLLTTDEFIGANAELLGNYLKGFKESIEYINEHIDEAAADISEEYGVDESQFISDWQNINFTIGMREEAATHLQDVADWAYEHEKFDTAYDIKEFMNSAAAEIAAPENTTIELNEGSEGSDE